MSTLQRWLLVRYGYSATIHNNSYVTCLHFTWCLSLLQGARGETVKIYTAIDIARILNKKHNANLDKKKSPAWPRVTQKLLKARP